MKRYCLLSSFLLIRLDELRHEHLLNSVWNHINSQTVQFRSDYRPLNNEREGDREVAATRS